jgi:hypothetical protein
VVPAELAAGGAVMIDGLAPHYSEANGSDAPRRVFTRLRGREGWQPGALLPSAPWTHAGATRRDGRFRISTLADFEGTEVASGPAPEVCTHA